MQVNQRHPKVSNHNYLKAILYVDLNQINCPVVQPVSACSLVKTNLLCLQVGDPTLAAVAPDQYLVHDLMKLAKN